MTATTITELENPLPTKRWSLDICRQVRAEHLAKVLARQQKLQRAQAQRRRRRKAR